MDTRTFWYLAFLSPFAYLQLPPIRQLAPRHPIAPRPINTG